MNDFVAYVKVLKINLDESTSIQQRNHLFNRLKKKIKKNFNVVINVLMIRNAFATLTQRIKNSQFSKNNQKNRIHNDRDFLNKSDFNSRRKLNNCVKNTKKRTKQRNQLNNKDCRNNIICLF